MYFIITSNRVSICIFIISVNSLNIGNLDVNCDGCGIPMFEFCLTCVQYLPTAYLLEIKRDASACRSLNISTYPHDIHMISTSFQRNVKAQYSRTILGFTSPRWPHVSIKLSPRQLYTYTTLPYAWHVHILKTDL